MAPVAGSGQAIGGGQLFHLPQVRNIFQCLTDEWTHDIQDVAIGQIKTINRAMYQDDVQWRVLHM